jgi:hypothetical protein
MQISGIARLLMLLPLAASISIVYRTIHCKRLRSVPLTSLTLTLTLVGGMMAIGVGLLIVFRLLA